MEHIAVWIAIANLFLTLFVIPPVLVWKATRIERALSTEIKASRDEIDGRIERQDREFGETVTAIREGMNLEVKAMRKEISEDQKFVRDTFIRRESFYKVMESIEMALRALGDKIEARLERMETKIDGRG